ncbi:MAG: hypothetical protein MZV70_41635 [Desulfobacterales bacterium]|nr:hypothetical protein [Desulfobacterales bacterium]
MGLNSIAGTAPAIRTTGRPGPASTPRPRPPRPPHPTGVVSVYRFFIAAVVPMLLWAPSAAGWAEKVSREQIKGLDEQVQEIKSDALGIAADLNRLEEKLLYPSNSQLAVFVSLAPGAKFRLDAVEIRVDGKPVAHHLYTLKELEALQRGGVQRIYTGNVRERRARARGARARQVGAGRRGPQQRQLQGDQGRGPAAGRHHPGGAGRGRTEHLPQRLVVHAAFDTAPVRPAGGRGVVRGQGPGARAAQGSVFRRGPVPRLPGRVLRRHRPARHRASASTTASTNRGSTPCTSTSTRPSSRSAISSSTTACTCAPAAPSRRCWKATSRRRCATRPPTAWRACTSRRTSSATP